VFFREKREMQEQSRAATAAERERRAAAWVKSSQGADVVHVDVRKMPTELRQQQERRERERALIVDQATAGCVADAVNQHFQESLKHVEQKVYRNAVQVNSCGPVPLPETYRRGLPKS